jgi:hypothetical protein
MIESTKDGVLGVDTSGEQMPPCVQYETTCLLIRDAVGSVPCLDECEFDVVTCLGSHGTRGVVVPRTTPRNLSIAMVPRTTLVKRSI